MAFNASKFISGAKNIADKVSDIRNAASNLKDGVSKLGTLSSTASSDAQWSGYSAAECKNLMEQLRANKGHLLACHYFVEFSPYGGNKTGNFPIVSDSQIALLVTETNLPVLQAEYDTAQVGAFTINQLKGISDPELQLNLIETREGDVMNSFRMWSELMVNDDGTMREPAKYAARLRIGVFDRYMGLGNKPYEAEFLVAPLLGSVESLAGESVSEVLKVGASFQVLRRFML